MKKVFVSMTMAMFLLGLAVAAQAVTINPGGGNNSETSLWTVVNTLIPGAAETQASLQGMTPLASIAGGSYSVTGYFKAAGFDQDFGFFNAAGTPTQGTDRLVQLGANGTYQPVSIAFSQAAPIAFYDFAKNKSTDTTYTITTLAGNLVGQGLIFDLGSKGFIVAFEDAAGGRTLGDKDYNDFVAHIVTPLPGSLMLLASGLIGVLGLRRRATL